MLQRIPPACFLVLGLLATSARAEVRFGDHVYIVVREESETP